ncbi:Hypothetical predicted protein [Olea europaea subsp. europaea]|uniref:Uncharacterized protein n=1 Tax=Olea europaea subsp. europaea TaxID=158383 RepID=A0A8S0V3L6_OLEEU|nr:Hypothetical predicted protein [Olea europaea subsp. europaea]
MSGVDEGDGPGVSCEMLVGSGVLCGSQGLLRLIGVLMGGVANDFKAGSLLMSIFPTLCTFSTVARTKVMIDRRIGVKKYGDVRSLINCEDVNDVKSDMMVVGLGIQRNQKRPEEGGCSDTIINLDAQRYG